MKLRAMKQYLLGVVLGLLVGSILTYTSSCKSAQAPRKAAASSQPVQQMDQDEDMLPVDVWETIGCASSYDCTYRFVDKKFHNVCYRGDARRTSGAASMACVPM